MGLIMLWLVSVLVGFVFLYLVIKFAISEDMFRLTTEMNAVKAQQERLHKETKIELIEIKNVLQEQNRYLAKLAEKD